MEASGQEIAYPTIDQIVDVNRRMIDSFGGSFTPPTNLVHRGSLEYILAAISEPIYGQQMFGSLKEKAAALAFHIIRSHPFFDGSKRTAIHIAWEFLRVNGVPFVLDLSIEELAVQIAAKQAGRDDLLAWLHGHQEE